MREERKIRREYIRMLSLHEFVNFFIPYDGHLIKVPCMDVIGFPYGPCTVDMVDLSTVT
jgi:hypothetical protein